MRKLTQKEIRLEQRPWVTRGLFVSMRVRDMLYKQLSREKESVLKAEISKLYKRYRNLIVTLLKKSKQNYFTFYFIEHQNNAKKNVRWYSQFN